MKILIIDDEKNIRDSLSRFFKLKNCETRCVENGISGKRALDEEVFDAVVTDLKMPGIDGIEFLENLMNEGIDIPVILISAHGQISDAVKAIKKGLADNTIIVLWGDHGYRLGDHSSWTKHTNFETDTRVPLLISVPGKAGGKSSRSLVVHIGEFLSGA